MVGGRWCVTLLHFTFYHSRYLWLVRSVCSYYVIIMVCYNKKLAEMRDLGKKFPDFNNHVSKTQLFFFTCVANNKTDPTRRQPAQLVDSNTTWTVEGLVKTATRFAPRRNCSSKKAPCQRADRRVALSYRT